MKYHLTDLGNAERLRHFHGRDIRHCYGIGWLVWDGKRWAKDDTQEVYRRAKQAIRSIVYETKGVTDEEQRKAILKWAFASEDSRHVNACVKLAEKEAGVAITTESLDRDPFLFNCANGTIDLRTGKFRQHDRRDLITKLSPVSYDGDAKAPVWTAFLDRVLAQDAELIGYIARFIGYAMTADVREHALLFLYGSGSNGKSTALGVILEMLGDYAIQAAPDLLLAKKNEGHPCDVADLRGRRLAVCSEMEHDRPFAEVTIKQLTGGDRVKARFMRQDFFEFAPSHKLIIAGNHKPKIKGTDEGIWRRIRLVPFTVTIKDDEKDKALPMKLTAELPGILRWAVEGCIAWQREGLGASDAIKKATDGYRGDMDRVGGFLAEECLTGDERYSAQATPLYKAYVRWAEDGGEKSIITQTDFGTRMAERGFKSERITAGPAKGRKLWRGVALVDRAARSEGVNGSEAYSN